MYKSGRNDCDRLIGITNTENLVMSLASCFAAGKFAHADHSFVYTQFDAHESGFIVPLPTSLVEEATSVRLVTLITLCCSDPADPAGIEKKFRDRLGPLYCG